MTDVVRKPWAAMGGTRFWAAPDTQAILPAGVYTAASSTRIGIYLDRMSMVHDDILALPDHGMDQVMDEIRRFWEVAPIFDRLGMVHKRGILLYGEPGVGKTALIYQITREFITNQNGIVMLPSSTGIVGHAIKLIRDNDPERPIMVIMEDVDALSGRGENSEFLALLDGQHQVGNVVFIATTNYLERLPDRLVCRPSRFDLVLEVKQPSMAARFAFFRQKLPEDILSKDDCRIWAEATDGLSVAFLKELIILRVAYGMPLEEAIKRLRDIANRKLVPQQGAIRVAAATASIDDEDEEEDDLPALPILAAAKR